MAFSPLPANYEDAIKEIKAWRAQHTKLAADAKNRPTHRGEPAQHHTPQPPRWYCVNSRGIARLCGSKEDAEHRAKLDDIDFPRYAPHLAVQLVDVSELEKERTALQEAQQRLADLQEQLVRAEYDRCAAVAAEREACAEIAADDDHIVDVPGYYAQLGDARATANNIEKAIRARSAS